MNNQDYNVTQLLKIVGPISDLPKSPFASLVATVQQHEHLGSSSVYIQYTDTHTGPVTHFNNVFVVFFVVPALTSAVCSSSHVTS